MVTVIIPSYNRAHLLPEIIPTYLQNNVVKIILIDDCSSDNTQEVVAKLQKDIPFLEYIQLKENGRQANAKNVGIDKVDTAWIYFGDDDSILYPDSIKFLLETVQTNNVDICGAKALYMEEDENNFEAHVLKNDILIPKNKSIVNLRKLETNFHYSVTQPISVPIVQASALVKTEWAKEIKFDTLYIGNSYREETDFFLRAKLNGAKIMYDSRAIQINLPRKKAKGGSHSSGKIKWYYYTIVNNHRFMKKNWKGVQKAFDINTPIFVMEIVFIVKLIKGGLKNILMKLHS